MPSENRILRIAAVLDRTGDSRAGHYAKVAERLFTPPVHIGPRAVGYPESEVEAILRARIAGWDDEKMRQLVRDLVQARAEAAPRIRQVAVAETSA